MSVEKELEKFGDIVLSCSFNVYVMKRVSGF